MEYNPRVQIIPAKPKPRDKRVAIYARVSSNSMEQLNSLTTQISGLTRLTAANPTWLLVAAYIDIESSKTGSHRKEFNRLFADCTTNKVDIVLTKNISRFGRDSLEILSALKKLRETNTHAIFETEEIDTEKTAVRLMISIIESFAQAENESRSDNIKWSSKQRDANDTSKLYDRKCYGYTNDEDGKWIIVEEKAKVVRLIFDWYLQGDSIGVIIKKLNQQGIKTSTGKDNWSKPTIDAMLSNEKYMGDALLQKTYTVDCLTKKRAANDGTVPQYYVNNDHEAIIPRELFARVQEEMKRRANIRQGMDGKRRVYSSKYALSGIVFWRNCGDMYRRTHWNNHGKKQIVWRCVTRLNAPGGGVSGKDAVRSTASEFGAGRQAESHQGFGNKYLRGGWQCPH